MMTGEQAILESMERTDACLARIEHTAIGATVFGIGTLVVERSFAAMEQLPQTYGANVVFGVTILGVCVSAAVATGSFAWRLTNTWPIVGFSRRPEYGRLSIMKTPAEIEEEDLFGYLESTLGMTMVNAEP